MKWDVVALHSGETRYFIVRKHGSVSFSEDTTLHNGLTRWYNPKGTACYSSLYMNNGFQVKVPFHMTGVRRSTPPTAREVVVQSSS
jgi:hypothetical protein